MYGRCTYVKDVFVVVPVFVCWRIPILEVEKVIKRKRPREKRERLGSLFESSGWPLARLMVARTMGSRESEVC